MKTESAKPHGDGSWQEVTASLTQLPTGTWDSGLHFKSYFCTREVLIPTAAFMLFFSRC